MHPDDVRKSAQLLDVLDGISRIRQIIADAPEDLTCPARLSGRTIGESGLLLDRHQSTAILNALETYTREQLSRLGVWGIK